MNGKSRAGWTIKTFASFEEAEQAERSERMAMTGEERLRMTEYLRAQYYGYAETGDQPRFERVIAVVPVP